MNADLIWGIVRVIACFFWGLLCFNAGKETARKEVSNLIEKMSKIFTDKTIELSKKYETQIFKNNDTVISIMNSFNDVLEITKKGLAEEMEKEKEKINGQY